MLHTGSAAGQAISTVWDPCIWQERLKKWCNDSAGQHRACPGEERGFKKMMAGGISYAEL